MPSNSIFNPLARVMVPALSRLQDEPDRYRSAYIRVAGLLLFLLLPMMACAAAFADVVIPLAFGQNWDGSVAIFTALGIAGLVQPLNNVAGWLFLSQGARATSSIPASSMRASRASRCWRACPSA